MMLKKILVILGACSALETNAAPIDAKGKDLKLYQKKNCEWWSKLNKSKDSKQQCIPVTDGIILSIQSDGVVSCGSLSWSNYGDVKVRSRKECKLK